VGGRFYHHTAGEQKDAKAGSKPSSVSEPFFQITILALPPTPELCFLISTSYLAHKGMQQIYFDIKQKKHLRFPQTYSSY
jgi:hypothetical protein